MIVSLAMGLFLVVSARVAGESYEPCLATWSYNEESNTCVKAFNEKKVTWKEASDICQSTGAVLVLIQSSQKNDFVQGLLSYKRYWIGSRYNSATKMMRYLEGGEVTPFYEAWAPRQPNNYRGNQECIEMIKKRGGLWNDRKCKRRNHFVCEKSTEEMQERGSVEECDQGWVYYDGDATCLLYKNDVQVSQEVAFEECEESFEGTIVTIRDKNKADFIRDMIFQSGRMADTLWIGLEINHELNTASWLNGEPLGDYHPWKDGHPVWTQYFSQCVFVHLDHAGSEWVDAPCGYEYHFICEIRRHP